MAAKIEEASANVKKDDDDQPPDPNSRTRRKSNTRMRRSSIATPYEHGRGVDRAKKDRDRERQTFERFYKMAGKKWQTVHKGPKRGGGNV